MKAATPRPLVAALCALLATAASAAAPAAASDTALLGFTADGSKQQQSLEKQFDAQLSADEMRDWLKQMSSEPNQVGSPHDKANAESMLTMFKYWGWDAHIETFYVLYPTPKEESLETGRADAVQGHAA